jgi:hypothetical protein
VEQKQQSLHKRMDFGLWHLFPTGTFFRARNCCCCVNKERRRRNRPSVRRAVPSQQTVSCTATFDTISKLHTVDCSFVQILQQQPCHLLKATAADNVTTNIPQASCRTLSFCLTEHQHYSASPCHPSRPLWNLA